MPAPDRLRPDEQTAPPLPRQHPGKARQQRPVSRPAARPPNLSAEYQQLLAQDEDLNLVGGIWPSEQHHQLKQAPQRPVEKGKGHPFIFPVGNTDKDRVFGTHRLRSKHNVTKLLFGEDPLSPAPVGDGFKPVGGSVQPKGGPGNA